MEIHGVLYHVPHKVRRQRTEELLKLFELWERRNDQVKKFSGGMKRRLEIARGFLHTPQDSVSGRAHAGPRSAEPQPVVDAREEGERSGEGDGVSDHALHG